MDFHRLIKSLDALVYEVLSWLLFYPMTIWWMLRQPVKTMLAVERELKEDAEHSFDDMIGPPLFLALTIGLLHLFDPADLVETTSGISDTAAGFLADEKNLVGARIILFGTLPLLAALWMVGARGERASMSSLRAPVYAACYPTAIFAFLFTVANHLTNRHEALAALEGVGILLAGIGWWMLVVSLWYRAELKIAWWRALLRTGALLVSWVVLLTVVGFLLGA
ncbi:hypothetical protein [Sphingomicrobium sediminis]|uniref:Permease n=1 Tax=Sphingomicrobium sediminis TaxID=2950949 RepID=A0A9X2EF90_9SPHN|nr:hypothetical protein [Sphingomicrobium sediminis]MCM8556462.1 hypothetical protein [Sphingomicrobium sediminis]